MLAAYVGEDVFLRGVSIYLKKHLFANSVSSDLWDGIGEAAGRDVTTMMNTWVSKVYDLYNLQGTISYDALFRVTLDGFPCCQCQGDAEVHYRTTRPLPGDRTSRGER